MQCLRWEGKVDPFGIEALHDLGVDPGGVVQICPIFWWAVPVDDPEVQGVGVEFVEGDTWRVARLIDRLVGMGVGFGFAGSNVRHFKRLTTMAELDNELAQAKASGKPVILDFYADWCVYCKTLENDIFPDANAQSAMGDAVLLQADVTDAGSDEAKAIMKRFGVIAPPVIVFWDKNGNELKQHKLVGDVTLEDFIAKTKTALQ